MRDAIDDTLLADPLLMTSDMASSAYQLRKSCSARSEPASNVVPRWVEDKLADEASGHHFLDALRPLERLP
jgi:hypothetical protein